MHVPLESVKTTNGLPATHQRIADSGNVLNTWFCSACGSSLFAENSARPRVRTIHIGTLDDCESVEVEAHIWVSRKLPWVCLPEKHRIYEHDGDWTEDYAHDLSRYIPASGT